MDVIKHFPGRSEVDLYMWLLRHQAALRERHNLQKTEVPEVVQAFLQAVEP